MDFKRIVRHLGTPPWGVRQAFPARVLRAIEDAVRASETRHRGELRFAVEGALDLPSLLRQESPRERAQEVFARLRVWDTAENNGVLIYVLVADRDVEIVADRGIDGRVGRAGWETICRQMEAAFRAGQFEAGVVEGVRAITEILAREYPASGPNPNELSDRPVVLP